MTTVTTTEVRFDRATEADAAALARAQKAAFDSQVPDHLPGLGGPPGYDEPAWQAATMREDATAYFRIAAGEGGEVIGGIVVRFPEPGHAHVERIFLHPEHHGRGVGTAAFAWLEASFPDVTLWTLRTASFHARNQRLYERLGYRRTGEVIHVFPFLSLVGFEKRTADGRIAV